MTPYSCRQATMHGYQTRCWARHIKRWAAVVTTVCCITCPVGCGTQPGLLREVPSELQFVLDNRDMFELGEHEFRPTEPGTVIDPPELMDGCWGRVEDSATGAKLAEFMAVNADSGTIVAQSLVGVDGQTARSDWLPCVLSYEETIVTWDEGTLVRVNTDVSYAGIDQQGRLVDDFSCGMSAAIDEGAQYYRYYTLDGDLLLLSGPSYDASGPVPRDVELFVRFDCP